MHYLIFKKNMNRILKILLIIFNFSIPAYAQLYESNCYFPQFGKSGEIDTLMGSKPNDRVGWDVFNSGPFEGHSDGKLFIGGLPGIPFLSAVDPVQPFDIHNIKPQKILNFNRGNFIGDFAHLHDSKHWDMYGISALDRDNPRIYWADDEGNYDTMRVTHLVFPKRHGYAGANGSNFPIIGKFTSDTVSDIILTLGYSPIGTGSSPEYLTLYKGGAGLLTKGDSAIFDSSMEVDPIKDYGADQTITGYLQNVEKESLIGIDAQGNWFLFQNNTPFSLSKLYTSLLNDTLLAKWQNPSITKDNGGIAMKLFEKSSTDSSDDLLCSFELSGNTVNDLNFFYKGGKDFGSKRIFVDNPDFLFHSPRYYDGSLFGYYIEPGLEFIGDLTGKGDWLYRTWAVLNDDAREYYYVMGKSLNDQVDMSFNPVPTGSGSNYAGFHARSGGRLDVLLGMPTFGSNSQGVLALVNTDNIPINGSSVKSNNQSASIEVYPNPVTTQFNFHSPEYGNYEIRIYDLLGRSIYHISREAIQLGSSVTVNLPFISSGSYILEISDGKKVYHSQLSIIH